MLRLSLCLIPFYIETTSNALGRKSRKSPGYWGAVAPLRCIHFCSFPKPWQQAPRGELERAWWVAFATCQLAIRRTAPAVAALLSPLPHPASKGADAAQDAGGAGPDAQREDGAAGGGAAAGPGRTEAGGGRHK